MTTDRRACTCHPSEAPKPCRERYALSECLAADRRAALVEKMISTFNGNYYNGLTNALSAALDLALEEAAKVADGMLNNEYAVKNIPAAIRALKGKP